MTGASWGRWGRVVLAAVVVAVCAAAAAVAQEPTAEDIINRVLTANAHALAVASADVTFNFRLNKPVTERPDCQFTGTVRLEHGHNTVTISQRTYGLTCWVLNKVVIGRLFAGTEPADQFLSRFDYTVLGEKIEDGRPFYLIRGTARDPKANPHGLVGWIDYERGLVTEGTLQYNWGSIDSTERYEQIEGAWVLVYQYLATTRFGASLEAEYSSFQFAPR